MNTITILQHALRNAVLQFFGLRKGSIQHKTRISFEKASLTQAFIMSLISLV